MTLSELEAIRAGLSQLPSRELPTELLVLPQNVYPHSDWSALGVVAVLTAPEAGAAPEDRRDLELQTVLRTLEQLK